MSQGPIEAPRARAGVVCGAVLLAAAALLLGCTPRPPPPRQATAAPAAEAEGTYVPGLGTFACVTPHDVCPNRFDIELREEPCTCQGEAGRYRYQPGRL